MSVAKLIEKKLTLALEPTALEIMDESHLHAGHAGSRPEGETHFRVKITSPRFAGLARVQCHRLVNEALAEELAGPIHALAVTTAEPA
ncbi:Cell division protein BolA [hydrothermal vent metagenome]|uniref:Cell division protein BolA n=1 Tax=hydrothermal vent metagenome TaxID=652676 RepID=A0A3B0SWI2_9ZZZZ